MNIIKQAAEIAFSLMKDSVLFMKKQYNLWTGLSGPGRIHESIRDKSRS